MLKVSPFLISCNSIAVGKNICGAQSSRNIRSIAAAGSGVLSEWPEADVTVYQSFSLRCNVFHVVVVFSKR